MDKYSFDVSMTPEARAFLKPGEALVLDWTRLAVCCAGAGEAVLYAASEDRLRKRSGIVRLKGEDPIYAARAIFPHLAGRRVQLDAKKTFGLRRFVSDLPGDFGLRAVMGYLPEPEREPDRELGSAAR
ncbi:MAG TPA: hypothetical protein VHM16_01570 [Rubrobacteraceae bacterium]|nr:hypothetical protein [Rubrobacteraceae bacterium]